MCKGGRHSGTAVSSASVASQQDTGFKLDGYMWSFYVEVGYSLGAEASMLVYLTVLNRKKTLLDLICAS